MTESPSRKFWILCVLFGVGVIAFAVWFSGVIPVETCTGPLPAGVSSLLSYQLARTPADIEAVFGPAGNPCRETMIAAMDRANLVDLVGFIATYSVFLACFFVALLRSGTGAVARIGLVAVAGAFVFDVLETWTQLYITGSLPGSGTSLALLAVGSAGKYIALAVVAVCAGLAMLARGGVSGRVAGVLCVVGGALVVVGFVYAPALAALGAGNAVAWVVVLLYAIVAAVLERPASRL
jgi:hypothetical protein